MAEAAAAPIRMLHLHSGNIMGGIESLMLTMAESAGFTPDTKHEFALTFDAEFAAHLRRTGATVHLLPRIRLRHLPSVYQSRRQLRMLLGQFQFDAVFAHSSWTQLLFSDIARRRSIPQIFWMHGPYDGHWLQKLASFQRPDFVICNSRYTRSTLDRCYANVPSTVLYGPVPKCHCSENRDELRRTLGIAPDELAILIAARMEAWKGHSDLLQALAALKTVIRWKLLIAGAPNSAAETAYFDSLQRQASVLGERVAFLGHRSDVRGLMAAADIYCQPNRKPEPFGVVYVEALHAGVPVVTSAMGGAREILDRNTGVLVEPGDTHALVTALTQLAES
ncbi:MAG: glycosyltransferase family 4 protein, partial [Terriglobales bacterium]